MFECIEANDRFDEKKAKYIFKQVGKFSSESRPREGLAFKQLESVIAESVAYLHRNGICHRDIKDENIVIDDKLQVSP